MKKHRFLICLIALATTSLSSPAATTWSGDNTFGGDVKFSGSLSWGWAYAQYGSFAMGPDTAAYGQASIATGMSWTMADWSVAMGYSSIAHGYSSVALIIGDAIGDYSAAIGKDAVASGASSVALGLGTTASSYACTAIGAYNKAEGQNSTAWAAADPLFVVGNGSGEANDPNRYHNAFTVYKNGKIKMDRQGDISMGEFGQ